MSQFSLYFNAAKLILFQIKVADRTFLIYRKDSIINLSVEIKLVNDL